MTTNLPYDLWIEESLRSVIGRALAYTAEHGLPGAHHFYITFLTQAPGVELAPQWRAVHPEEMTVVLQHQFWDLEVNEDGFSVTLKFQGRSSRVRIPFSAVTAFGDPSVNFGLQFRPRTPTLAAQTDGETASEDEAIEPERGEVITLDSFRKK
jgi:hypothetical protein